VPAHKGITEIADQLAKEGCSSNNRPDYRIPHSDPQIESKADSQRRFQAYLTEQALVKGQHYTELYSNLKVKPW